MALPICGVPQVKGLGGSVASGVAAAAGRGERGGRRSEERRVGKSVDLSGRRIIKKKRNHPESHSSLRAITRDHT